LKVVFSRLPTNF